MSGIISEPPKDGEPTYVTKPDLPPLEEFLPYLESIWKSHRLTNAGPFHEALESELCHYLGVKHLSLFTNGTIALITALQALKISGEVITTPYSFVATSHSLVWNGISPVFVDIDPADCNIDVSRIEAAITPRTTAILPVHCYGNPCKVAIIQKIADNYGLRVIYDAAHAFAVRHQHQSLLNHGDLSVLSFHATKVFNTFEGGAIVSQDAKTKQRIDYLKNFGFADEVTVVAPGINGKMNEFQAALGLLQLKYVEAAIQKRKLIETQYREGLKGISGISMLPLVSTTQPNHSYMPIFVTSEYGESRDALYDRLKRKGIHGRRYFFPLISQMPMYRGLLSASASNLEQATRVSSQVICLPIYPGLDSVDVSRTIDLIRVI